MWNKSTLWALTCVVKRLSGAYESKKQAKVSRKWKWSKPRLKNVRCYRPTVAVSCVPPSIDFRWCITARWTALSTRFDLNAELSNPASRGSHFYCPEFSSSLSGVNLSDAHLFFINAALLVVNHKTWLGGSGWQCKDPLCGDKCQYYIERCVRRPNNWTCLIVVRYILKQTSRNLYNSIQDAT